MQIWHDELDFDFSNPEVNQYFTENSLFFDIETTGFSPARTSLYLIGCAARKNDRIILDQFFADTKDEEKEILHSFFSYLKNFSTIITFNGIGFDIPYLKTKCETYGMTNPFGSFDYIDIYKSASKIKFLLQLPNFKQKTIEGFLGIGRKDLCNGGELIEVYHAYTKKPSEELLSLLKQHNYEDVLDMPNLLPLLSYNDVLSGAFSIKNIEANQYTAYDGSVAKELILTLENTIAIPKRVSCHYEDFHLIINTNETKLSIRLLQQELKFFFADYKNYFYLPAEDIAIHKNLASSVPKERKKKATAATCYTRKTAIFIPQYKELIAPAFRLMYKDKKSYFELSEDFIASKQMQREYVLHAFEYIRSMKK